MKGNFEDKIKDLVYNHTESAPDVMDKVFEKRTPLYVFRNKLVLHKYKLIAASLGLAFLLFMFNIGGDQGTQIPNDQQTTQQIDADKLNSGQIDQETTQMKHDDNKGRPILDGSSNHNQGSAEEPLYTNTDASSNVQNDGADQPEISDVVIETQQEPTSGSDDGHVTPSIENDVVQNDVVQDIEEDQPIEIEKPPLEVAVEDVVEENVNQTGIEETKDDVIAEVNVDQDQDVIDQSVEPDDTESEVVVDHATENGNDEFLPAKPINRWSIGVAYGVGIGNRSFDNSNGEQERSILARNESEKQRISSSAEITLNFKATSNIEIYSGVSYFNRRESMNYEKEVSKTHENITSQKVTEYHPVYGPREITLYDTTYQTVTVKNNLGSNNSYKHVSVPLGIRYTLYKKNIGFYLSGNVGLEVLTKTSGSVLDGDYNEVSLDNNFARTTLGTTMGIGAGVSYLLNDRFTALFEPRATIYLSPINKTSYPLNQWDQGYSLTIGLKYGF